MSASRPTASLIDEIRIVHNAGETGGEFVVAGEREPTGELTYQRLANRPVIVIDHTWVSPELRGQGVARKLVDAALAWARSEGLGVVPACSYVRLVFTRNPSLADMLRTR